MPGEPVDPPDPREPESGQPVPLPRDHDHDSPADHTRVLDPGAELVAKQAYEAELLAKQAYELYLRDDIETLERILLMGKPGKKKRKQKIPRPRTTE
jgi:hypothetical protein